MINALKERELDREAEIIESTAVSKGGEWQKWANTLGAYLGRYIKKGKGPAYDTATCKLWKANDALNENQRVPHTARRLV